jgi:hypothetical protein
MVQVVDESDSAEDSDRIFRLLVLRWRKKKRKKKVSRMQLGEQV